MLNIDPRQILLTLPAIVIGFTFHEAAHAFAAVRLGDRTPIEQGRYTLNPLPHISWVGLVLILLVGFGWAKPVQFTAANLRHPGRDKLLVALAGPAANLLIALFFFGVVKLLTLVVSPLQSNSGGDLLYQLIIACIWINLLLFLFNLLPIPPLDGSYLVLEAIPDRYALFKAGFVRYGAIVFLAVIVVKSVTRLDIFPIGRVTSALFQLISGVFLPGNG